LKILRVLISLLLISEVFAQKNFSVGVHFPNIELPALSDGTLRSVSDYLGQKVILHIFASW